jgi:hypothetical protein
MGDKRFRSARWLAGFLLLACAGGFVVWYADLFGKPPPKPPDDSSGRIVADEPPLRLGQDQLEHLWQVEHQGNILSKYGFKPLAQALARADAQALGRLLAADFKGQTLRAPQEVRLEEPHLRVVRQQDAGTPALDLDRAGFLARLLGFRKPFTGVPGVKVSLMGLSPTDRADLTKPWRGTCQLRMWGLEGVGRPREVVLYLAFRVAQPQEGTLARGGWLRACSLTQSQVGTSDRFLLRDATAERGLDPNRWHDNWVAKTQIPATGGVYLCDFDRDGILDMLVTDVTGCVLYKGLPGGKFRNVTAQVGLPETPPTTPLGRVAAFLDIDGDGWEDLILGDTIYRNDRGKKFVNMTSRCNLFLPENAIGLAVADYDRDGRVDLYVCCPGRPKVDSWLSGKSADAGGNQLWRNLGNWRFENVTHKSGTAGGDRSTFSAVWLDANNDGWPDLYVINEFGNGVLLVNQGNGTFQEKQLAGSPVDFGSMGVTCGDIDNDGNIDIYCANMYSKAGNRVFGNVKPGTYPRAVMDKIWSFVGGSQLHRNKGGLRFEQLGQKYQVRDVGWAYGAALIDLDNDGWLDLYTTAGFISRSRSEPDG